MRNPVATPASVIFGILVFGFLLITLFSFLTITKNDFILEKNRALFIWGNGFLKFLDVFIALQCAGALISYSLFLTLPTFVDRKVLFRSFRSIIVSLLLISVLYIGLFEGFAPVVRRTLHQAKTMGRFSEAMFDIAQSKKKAGDVIGALEALEMSLAVDSFNPEKVSENSLLLSLLSDEEFREYLALSNLEDAHELFNPSALLERAQNAFEAKDYDQAYLYATQLLSIENTNAQALSISSIAGEQSRQRSATQAEDIRRFIYDRKKEGYDSLTSGTSRDVIRAYFVFLDLWNRYPLEPNVREYLVESRNLLPSVSFFIRDAQNAFSFQDLVKKNIVFFNKFSPDERELVSIGEMVAVGNEKYFKNIEVVGFIRGNQVSYQYTAPYGKLLVAADQGMTDYFINFTGIEREDPTRRTGVQYYIGTPQLDRERGFRLNTRTGKPDAMPFNPLRLDYFALAKSDLAQMGVWELVSLLGPLSLHAKMDELLVLEVLSRLCQPFLLIILTFLCLNFGMTQRARYLASPPKIMYLWVLLIPLVMMSLMDLFLFIHRMGLNFLYYVFGTILGSIIVFGVHIFFLIVTLTVFLKKYSSPIKP